MEDMEHLLVQIEKRIVRNMICFQQAQWGGDLQLLWRKTVNQKTAGGCCAGIHLSGTLSEGDASRDPANKACSAT